MMLDILYMRMGINCPTSKSQEELKYLMCLDFKYLEMVMLVKFDKIMHNASQEDLFSYCAQDVVVSVANGFNGTVMCYG